MHLLIKIAYKTIEAYSIGCLVDVGCLVLEDDEVAFNGGSAGVEKRSSSSSSSDPNKPPLLLPGYEKTINYAHYYSVLTR